MMRASIIAWLACLAAACHYHRDTNAPAHIDVNQPPRDVTSEVMEYPNDPGERMIMLTTGVLAGGGARAKAPHGIGDFAVEATVSWGENPTSHNDGEARLFIPARALWPNNATGVTLGWSALRVAEAPDGTGSEAQTGPIYVEVHRAWLPWSVGGGWAVDPTSGDHGPQVNAMILALMYTRARYLFDGGFEFHVGAQLKIPNTWVWSR